MLRVNKPIEKGSQEDREKQFEDYLIPLVMPFVKDFGLTNEDDFDSSEEALRECLKWLEGDFTECGNLDRVSLGERGIE